jgi:hypothetical protein
MQFPTNAWRRNLVWVPRILARPNQSAPAVILDARPQPTIIRAALVDLFPETLGECSRFIVTVNKAITDRLTAATFTEFGKFKLKLGGLWGMLGHVNSPFVTLTTPPAVTSSAVATLLVATGVIVAQMSGVG